MNREMSIERTWQLVQFEPLRVVDTITEIPDVVASNQEAMKLLRYLQLIDIEWTYIRYNKLRSETPKLTSLESIAKAQEFLEQERRTTFENLLASLSAATEESKSEKGE